MKKQLFIVAFVALFLMLPISVYAYNNTFNTDENNTFRFGMMNRFYGMDNEQHEQFIEEQKQLIEEKVLSGELTREEADQYILELDQMQSYHELHHSNTTNSFSRCH